MAGRGPTERYKMISLLGGGRWNAPASSPRRCAAAIICTGAVSIVAVFVTGRLTSTRSKDNPANGEAINVPIDR